MAHLPHPLSDLLSPDAYDHPVARIEVVETHISWVILTGEFAYKIKRPVQYGFVDLRSPERREFLCHEEIRLNRRFSRDLYLDVWTVNVDGGRARMRGDGKVIEHAVRMRQFDRAQELDRLLDAQAIGPSELARFGRDLANIHAALPHATVNDEWGRQDQIANTIVRNVAECKREAMVFGTSAELTELAPLLRDRVEAAAPWMVERREEGRVREAHGDLHARNLLRHRERLVAFDSIDFDPGLRWIDVADEIAFLVADVQARGHASNAHAFLNAYLSASGDYHACRFLNVYRAHRALVRAKVEAIAVVGKDSQQVERARPRHRAYIETARQALTSRKPMMILMSGASGSGKSWLAERLATALGAIHIRSDVERRRLLGGTTTGELGAGRYAPEHVARVYQHLARCSEDVLSGGYDVIVDATFRDRNERSRFQDLAKHLGVTLRLIYCHVDDEELLLRRIEQRVRARNDDSDADERVLSWQQERFDPILPDEGLEVIDADTTNGAVVEGILQRLG